ncbi:MAG: hypothetical protein JW950_00320 [Deltaproteobacteria bacterium]|nr:hypothetical protein [Deltaproteobacteria bacterium]
MARLERKTGRYVLGLPIILPLILIGILAAACVHFPDDTPKLDKSRREFDGDQKTVLKAIRTVLLNRDFGEAAETKPGRLETDYVVQGDWRTRVIATVRPIGRRRSEVTLAVITEKRSSDQWIPKSVMGKEQYEEFFDEIEIQTYREWYKAQ